MSKVSESELSNKIATAPSPKFLGLFPGFVYDYAIFDRFVLDRDLDRVARFYRARGYYDARVRAGRVETAGDSKVRVTVMVEEGEPVVVGNLTVSGLDTLLPEERARVVAEAEATLPRGKPFDEDVFEGAEGKLLRTLADFGYAFAKGERSAQVDLPAHMAHVQLALLPDKKARFGTVTVEGTGGLPEPMVRRVLDLYPEEPYSKKAIEEGRQALLDLGVFSVVTIEPALPDPPPEDRVVPLRVTLEPARLRSVSLGVGAEFDAIRTELHGQAGWEDRNFLGGLRRFSIVGKPGVVFYPTRTGALVAPTDFLPLARLRAELKQPALVEARTGGFIRSEATLFPVLIQSEVDERAPVLGYGDVRGSFGVERVFGHLYASPSYNVQSNTPFSYKGALDPNLDSVLLSYVALYTTLDLRNDPIRPRRGFFLSSDLQFAGLGGSALDVRVSPEVRAYVPLADEVVLAARAQLGFLFPMNYGDTLLAVSPATPSDAERRDWTRDVQLTYFRGFFSGGPSSNRGYPLRGVGPHGVVPFFAPTVALDQLARACDPASPDFDAARCAVPLGGFSLWEAGIELRFKVSGPVSSALFCDASDVSPRTLELRLKRPHLSCGAGARYETPVGPIRLDVGYRIPGAQILETIDPREEAEPPTPFNSGIPIAFSFGIGEAF